MIKLIKNFLYFRKIYNESGYEFSNNKISFIDYMKLLANTCRVHFNFHVEPVDLIDEINKYKALASNNMDEVSALKKRNYELYDMLYERDNRVENELITLKDLIQEKNIVIEKLLKEQNK